MSDKYPDTERQDAIAYSMESLEAEIAQLREAMKKVLDVALNQTPDSYKVTVISIIASKALGQAPPTQF